MIQFRLLCMIALAMSVSNISAWLPGDIPVDPSKMRAGESACVFPVHHTRQGNVWISRQSVYRRNDKKDCILDLFRTDGGWRVITHGIPIRRGKSSDSELRSFGWIQLGPAEKVIVTALGSANMGPMDIHKGKLSDIFIQGALTGIYVEGAPGLVLHNIYIQLPPSGRLEDLQGITIRKIYP